MSSSNDSSPKSNRSVEWLLAAAGGAILAGALGAWIFELFKESIPSIAISIIAGMAGGGVSLAQRYWSKKNERGERE